MNPSRMAQILTMFTSCPIVSTDQVARLFTNAQPDKRASAALVELEQDGLVEGRRREMGKPKVWRLTRAGHRKMAAPFAREPLTSRKLEHWLALADMWVTLRAAGELLRWRVELREVYGGGVYCPDAFYALRMPGGTQLRFLEVQLTEQTSDRWARKWAVASGFFDSPAFAKGSFQTFLGRDNKPVTIKADQVKIVVVSKQQPDTITAGTRLPLILSRDVKNAPL